MTRELNINELETINGGGYWKVFKTIVKHQDKVAFVADVAGGLYGGYSLGEAVEEASKDYLGTSSFKDPGNGGCSDDCWRHLH